MRHSILASMGVTLGLGVLALPLPEARGADSASASQDTVSITAEVELTSERVPSDFTVVVDPDPTDPDAKLQFLKYVRWGDYRLDTKSALGDRAEIYLVSPAKYRAHNPWSGQYSPIPIGNNSAKFKVRRTNPKSPARVLTFWKHQVNLHLKGNGEAEETRENMADGYPRRMQDEFPSNSLAKANAPPLTLWSMHRIFAMAAKDNDLAQARQQYLALLLNTVSGKLTRDHQVADDGTTVNDAIRYLGVLIEDDKRKNDDDATEIARRINEAREVESGKIPNSCLSPVSAQLDSGREIRVFKHGGAEIDGRFSGLALDRDLLTMTVVSDGGDQNLDLPANQILKIQYEDEGKISAGAVIGGFLLGAFAGLVVGSLLVDEDAGAGQFFYVPPEPFVGAGLGAIVGMLGGAAISGLPDTRTIECEDGLAKITE